MRTRVVLAAVTALGVAILSGCGAGQDAQTSLTQPSIAGVSADVGDIAVRNAVVPFAEAGYPAGGEAPVRFAVANNGREPVRLGPITSENAASVTVASVTMLGAAAPGNATPPAATPTTAAPATPSPTAAAPTTAAPATPTPTAATPSTTPPGTTAPPNGGAPTELILEPGGFATVTLHLIGLTQPLDVTGSVPLTLTFDNGASVALVVPMAPPEQALPRESPMVEGGEGH